LAIDLHFPQGSLALLLTIIKTQRFQGIDQTFHVLLPLPLWRMKKKIKIPKNAGFVKATLEGPTKEKNTVTNIPEIVNDFGRSPSNKLLPLHNNYAFLGFWVVDLG